MPLSSEVDFLWCPAKWVHSSDPAGGSIASHDDAPSDGIIHATAQSQRSPSVSILAWDWA
jgi:hypothetical protein